MRSLRTVSFLLVFLLGYALLSAQSFSLQYKDIATFGSGLGRWDVAEGVVSDSIGNVYVIGAFYGYLDFDPSAGESIGIGEEGTLYLAKYDSSRQLQWVHTFQDGHFFFNHGYKIQFDRQGNLIVCGSYTNEIRPDPNTPGTRFLSFTPDSSDVFVAKYTPSGQFCWFKSYGGIKSDQANSMVINSQNEIYIAGAIKDTVDFDPGPGVQRRFASGTEYSPYLLKLDSSGNFIHAFVLNGNGQSAWGKDVELTASGDVVLSGGFNGSLDLDPGAGTLNKVSAGWQDAFVARYSPSGALQWGFSLGGSDFDEVNDLTVGPNDRLTFGGRFRGKVDFDASADTFFITTSQFNTWDLFLATYEGNGTFRDAFALGGNGNDLVNHVEVDQDQNVYVGGYAGFTMDFDPGPGTVLPFIGSGRDFIASYDSTGNYRWVTQTSSGSPRHANFSMRTPGQLITVGRFKGYMVLDPGPGGDTLYSDATYVTSFLARYALADGAYLNSFALEDVQGGSDGASRIVGDDHGNYYVCGGYKDKVDFDTSAGKEVLMTSQGQFGDTWLARWHDQTGLVWVKDFQGLAISKMTLDKRGNLLIAGNYGPTVDVDPDSSVFNLVSTGGSDVCILKLDSYGKFIWARSVGGIRSDEAFDIHVDHANNVLVTGYYRDSADFDPGPGKVMYYGNNRNAFLVKLDSSGNYKWSHGVGAPGTGLSGDDDVGYSVGTDAIGNVYWGGNFSKTVDFAPGQPIVSLTSNGSSDGFVAVYSPTGILHYVNQYGGNDLDMVAEVEVEPSGRFYAAGQFSNTVDFDPGPGVRNLTSAGSQDYFVLCAEPGGQPVWEGRFGSNFVVSYPLPDESFNDMILKDGRLYVNGSVWYGVDYDMDTAVANRPWVGGTDIFISVYDTAGQFLDAATFGTGLYDTPGDMAVVDDDLFLVGSVGQPMDFDPGPGLVERSGISGSDAFILRFGTPDTCSPLLDTLVISTCGLYTAPSGQRITGSGLFYDTKPNGSGCDSVFRIEMSMSPPIQGDSLVVHRCYDYFDAASGVTYTRTGDYYRVLRTAAGCDSLTYLQLFLDTTSTVQQVNACGSFNYKGTSYTSNALVIDTLTNHLGCDSLLFLELEVNPNSYDSLTVLTCNAYTWQGNTFSSSGTYDTYLVNSAGCDSILTLNLTIGTPRKAPQVVRACGSYSWRGVTYQSSGVFQDTSTVGVCDTIHTLNLTLLQPTASSVQVTACSTYQWLGQTYTTSGLYQDTLVNSLGCDSVLTLDLLIGQATTSMTQVTSCGAYQWQGQTFSSTGLYRDTLVNGRGCDSILTLDLVIGQPTTSLTQVSSCGSYQWQGQTYTNSGTYRDTLANSAGCDSILTLDLIVTGLPVGTATFAACDSFIWRGGVYHATGTYRDTVSRSGTCDSVAVLQLTIGNSSSRVDTVFSCGAYTWPANGLTYSNSGNFSMVLSGANGCDSTLFLDLTIQAADTAVLQLNDTLRAMAVGATYQWLDCGNGFAPVAGATGRTFVPLVAGQYALQITQGGCTDTSACRTVVMVGVIDGTDFGQAVTVYPNPGNGRYTVALERAVAGRLDVEVTDVQGRVVTRQVVRGARQFDVVVEGSAGVYVLRVEGADGAVGRFLLVKE